MGTYYVGLRFPLATPRWLPRRTPAATGGTPVDPSTFVPALADVSPSWTQNLLPLNCRECVQTTFAAA